MKAPVICIVHMIPTRSDGICPYCEGHYHFEQVRAYNRMDQAYRIANKLMQQHEDDLEQLRRMK